MVIILGIFTLGGSAIFGGRLTTGGTFKLGGTGMSGGIVMFGGTFITGGTEPPDPAPIPRPLPGKLPVLPGPKGADVADAGNRRIIPNIMNTEIFMLLVPPRRLLVFYSICN